MTDTTIAFIGTGNMATSILTGLIRNDWPQGNIIATARTKQTLSSIHQQYGIQTTRNNQQAARQADVVMLCVKPQMMKSVLTELAPALKAGTLLISVAAGITMGSLEQWSGNSHAIVRSMPNTPSMVQCGACGLFANALVTEPQKSLTQTIFSAIGLAEWVEQEALIDAVIAVSGSGPAYYFLFMEAMKKVGTELGLPPETAEKLTLQTALGAARMASESGVDVAELRRRVTSPNGTTEQAINAFLEGDLPGLVGKAMEATVKRAGEMARELSD